MTTPQSTPAPQIEQEEWRPAPGWEEHYEVSNLGRVRGIAPRNGDTTPRYIITPPNQDGYLTVRFYRGRVHRRLALHLLIARAFLGPCPPLHEVNHRDGNKTNAALSNLEYVTKTGNRIHAVANGLCHYAKLNADIVREVRRSTASHAALARHYGVGPTCIRDIRSGRTWWHVDQQEVNA